MFRAEGPDRSSGDRGRRGIAGSTHHGFNRQQLSDAETFSLKNRGQRPYSTSPPASSSLITKKQRTESPDHDLTRAHAAGWVADRVGRETSDCESNGSDSGHSSHPTQAFDWDRDADSRCRSTSEPSSTGDSPRSTHTAQFSQSTRPSTCSSHDYDNTDIRCPSPLSDMGQAHDDRPATPPLGGIDWAHLGLGLQTDVLSRSANENDPLVYSDTHGAESSSTQSMEPTEIRVDLRGPRLTPPSDRNDGSSTEGESKSSQEQETDEDSSSGDDSELAQLAKAVLGPVVGKYFHEAAKGTLVFMPRQKVSSIDELRGLSLLDACNLDFTGVVPYTVAASDSSGGSSDSSARLAAGSGGGSGGSSSSRQNSARGDGSNNITNNNQSGRDKSTPTAKPDETDQLNLSVPRRNLRCPFNAALPQICCVNQRTGRKFQACEGPGYNTMQYLKEHVQKVHGPLKDKSKDLPRCGRCQETFETNDLLQDHMDNVDCPLKCAECKQEFASKPARKTHRDEKHAVPDTIEIALTNIDDEKYAEIKSRLKAYSESLRKGKRTQNKGLQDWISNNTEAFMQGRNPEINPQLQLGQWHIMFTTLFPERAVPEHPFYEIDDVIMKGEEAMEQIMHIWKLVVMSKRADGQLNHPADPERWILSFEDILRETLTLASQTTLLKSMTGKIHISNDDVLGGNEYPQTATDTPMGLDHSFLDFPQQSSSASDAMQNQMKPAVSNQQSVGLFPPNEHSMQQYGSDIAIGNVSLFPSYSFPHQTAANNWDAPGGSSGQQYTDQAQFYVSSNTFGGYPDPGTGAPFPNITIATGSLQPADNQVLPGNAYPNQHPETHPARSGHHRRPASRSFNNNTYPGGEENMQNNQQ